MDLKAKIEELSTLYNEKALSIALLKDEVKEIKKKISKYETVLKHANEIEAVEEKPLV